MDEQPPAAGSATVDKVLHEAHAEGLPSTAGFGREPAAPRAPLGDSVPELMDHPRYRIFEVLGRGRMGTVFKAEHRLMERLVALKVIAPEVLARPGAAPSLQREVRAAARISHPNIVEAFDAEQLGGTHVLITEFVEGENLAEVLRAAGRLPVAQACAYARQACLGMQHAYELGQVHGDIKPARFMLTVHGQVKLLDFGLARFAAAEASLRASAAADYAAPERIQQGAGWEPDLAADIYSLGCTLYHFLAGIAPFAEISGADKLSMRLEKPPRPLRELRPELPPPLIGVVEKMMAPTPSERWQTPAELAAALAPFAVPGCGVRKSGRWILAAAMLLAILGCAAMAFSWLARSRQVSPAPNAGTTGAAEATLAPSRAEKKTTTTPPPKLDFRMEFILVPRGKAWLGGGAGKPGTQQVDIPYDFYLGKYEVTQEEWQKVMDFNPSHFSRTGGGQEVVKNIPDTDLTRFPVENVTWNDCREFVTRLNERMKENGWVYRLPTEAEWEYACRGGPMVDQAESAFDFYVDKPTNQLLPSVGKGPPLLKAQGVSR